MRARSEQMRDADLWCGVVHSPNSLHVQLERWVELVQLEHRKVGFDIIRLVLALYDRLGRCESGCTGKDMEQIERS